MTVESLGSNSTVKKPNVRNSQIEVSTKLEPIEELGPKDNMIISNSISLETGRKANQAIESKIED